jgi:hypothetical protein
MLSSFLYYLNIRYQIAEFKAKKLCCYGHMKKEKKKKKPYKLLFFPYELGVAMAYRSHPPSSVPVRHPCKWLSN